MKPPMSYDEIRASLPRKVRKRLRGHRIAAITAASVVSNDMQVYKGDERPDKPDVIGMLRLKLNICSLVKSVKKDEIIMLVEIITGT